MTTATITTMPGTTTIPAGFLVAWPIESESSVAGSRSHRHVAVLGGGCAAQELHVEWAGRREGVWVYSALWRTPADAIMGQ